MRHYIISNCDEAAPWVTEHMEELRRSSIQNVENRHKEKFVSWFQHQETT
ncbi:hypothetical protein ACP4OV_014804 [Aristida adscensionis]